MSNFYYLIEKIARDTFKSNKLTLNKLLYFIKSNKLIFSLFIVVELLLITLVICNSRLGNWNWIILLVIFVCMLFICYKSSKLETALIIPHNELTIFKEVLEQHGFKRKEDIEMLQNEIEIYLSKEINYLTSIFSSTSKLFFFLFWVPSGFLLNYFFSQLTETLNLSQLIQIMSSLLLVTVNVIAILIVAIPIVRTSIYSNKKQIFLYLEDVKYYYDGCVLEITEK
ncbi:hypothetical protein [Carnobacterium mobile]|uniref:hypothetical protein n=1 Tax=Carnobacterium mobile TaxID=2750 RepID=UPI000559357B|nr:hypothetical protein [Carnobacterium mobile]